MPPPKLECEELSENDEIEGIYVFMFTSTTFTLCLCVNKELTWFCY